MINCIPYFKTCGNTSCLHSRVGVWRRNFDSFPLSNPTLIAFQIEILLQLFILNLQKAFCSIFEWKLTRIHLSRKLQNNINNLLMNA